MSNNGKIQCLLCGDVIESTHTHDYKNCKCGLTFVDGGSDYLRCGSIVFSRIRTLDGPGVEKPNIPISLGEDTSWVMDDPAMFLAIHVVYDQWRGNDRLDKPGCPHCLAKKEDDQHRDWCIVNFSKGIVRNSGRHDLIEWVDNA